jgi:hypothetical protein
LTPPFSFHNSIYNLSSKINNLASHSERSDRVVAGFHACIVTLSETKGLVVEILRRNAPQNDILNLFVISVSFIFFKFIVLIFREWSAW